MLEWPPFMFLFMSLYRFYRPQSFGDLAGQDAISRTLKNAVESGRIHHAYLFTGPRGTGKTSTARILAKAINCAALKAGEPCNACEFCMDTMEGRLMDLVEIDAASNRGIDEMRDLREKVVFSPSRARAKVYIIDEVHMLTKEAFNALLKTLEEPPSNVFFILATTEVHKIPETILSRCQRFDFRRIGEKDLVDRLKFIAEKEGISAEDEALRIIAHHAEGGMRDAIGLLEQLRIEGVLSVDEVCRALGVSGIASLERLYEALERGAALEGLAEVHGVYEQGYDLYSFTKSFLEFLRVKMLESVEAAATAGSSAGDSAKTGRLVEMIGHFQKAYEQVRYAPIEELPLELAVVGCCHRQGGVFDAGKSAAAMDVSAKIAVAAPVATTTVEKKVEVVEVKVEVTETVEVKKMPETENLISAQGAAPLPAAAPETKNEKPLTLDEVQAAWSKILTAVNVPTAKRSLQHAKPLRMDGVHTVIIGYASNFHIEKMRETDNRTALEQAFHGVLGTDAKILGEVVAGLGGAGMATAGAGSSTGGGAGMAANGAAREPSMSAQAPPENSMPMPPDLGDTVMDMFEGEMA